MFIINYKYLNIKTKKKKWKKFQILKQKLTH